MAGEAGPTALRARALCSGASGDPGARWHVRRRPSGSRGSIRVSIPPSRPSRLSCGFRWNHDRDGGWANGNSSFRPHRPARGRGKRHGETLPSQPRRAVVPRATGLCSPWGSSRRKGTFVTNTIRPSRVGGVGSVGWTRGEMGWLSGGRGRGWWSSLFGFLSSPFAAADGVHQPPRRQLLLCLFVLSLPPLESSRVEATSAPRLRGVAGVTCPDVSVALGLRGWLDRVSGPSGSGGRLL